MDDKAIQGICIFCMRPSVLHKIFGVVDSTTLSLICEDCILNKIAPTLPIGRCDRCDTLTTSQTSFPLDTATRLQQRICPSCLWEENTKAESDNFRKDLEDMKTKALKKVEAIVRKADKEDQETIRKQKKGGGKHGNDRRGKKKGISGSQGSVHKRGKTVSTRKDTKRQSRKD